MMVDVIMNNHDLQWALDLAKEAYKKRVAYAEASGMVKVRKDRLLSYLVGKLGEIGAYNWLKDDGFQVDPLFATDDNAPDIYCRKDPEMRIEVKSWQKHQWDSNLGRAIPSYQFEHVCMFDNLVIWVHMDLFRPLRPLNLKSTLEDVCFLFKSPTRTIQLAEYSWTRDLKRIGAMKDVEVSNGDGAMLKSKQMTCCGNSPENFRVDVLAHLCNR
jgi:hypothetical protein